MEKIFIVTTNKDDINKYFLAEHLSNMFDLDIAHTTICNTENFKDFTEYKYLSSLAISDMMLAYKNNALLYSLNIVDKYGNNVIESITMDDYYNKDIFCMSIEAFNNISDNRLVNCLVIWLDSNIRAVTNISLNMIKYFEESIKDIPYLYFNEDINTVYKVVDAYLNGDPIMREQILEENS